jgi:hypothetical protein
MIDVADVAFFVTGMGRSGSKWLRQLLLKTPSDVKVMHEPLGRKDEAWYGRVYRNPALGPEWIWHRVRWMDTERTGGKRWGEVNSYLRYAVHDLREAFPGVPVVGLVRDGRFTVRSLMRLGIYAKRQPPIPPPTWAETPFQRCCWYWADAYRILVAWGVPIFRLEDLNADYAEVEVLCAKLGIEPPTWQHWAKLRHKPANATKPHGARLEWSTGECEAFRRAAGDMQRRFGYPVFMKTGPLDAPPKKLEGSMGVWAEVKK